MNNHSEKPFSIRTISLIKERGKLAKLPWTHDLSGILSTNTMCGAQCVV